MKTYKRNRTKKRIKHTKHIHTRNKSIKQHKAKGWLTDLLFNRNANPAPTNPAPTTPAPATPATPANPVQIYFIEKGLETNALFAELFEALCESPNKAEQMDTRIFELFIQRKLRNVRRYHEGIKRIEHELLTWIRANIANDRKKLIDTYMIDYFSQIHIVEPTDCKLTSEEDVELYSKITEKYKNRKHFMRNFKSLSKSKKREDNYEKKFNEVTDNYFVDKTGIKDLDKERSMSMASSYIIPSDQTPFLTQLDTRRNRKLIKSIQSIQHP